MRHGPWNFPFLCSMRLRIFRILIANSEFETEVTSLPVSFTLEDIKKLYNLR